MKENIALHVSAVECLRSMWFSLHVSKKLAFGRTMLESVLDLLSSIQTHQLNRVLLIMFGDILKTEGYYYNDQVKQVPDQPFNVYKWVFTCSYCAFNLCKSMNACV